jgi:outer membrane lipoprotein LolB
MPPDATAGNMIWMLEGRIGVQTGAETLSGNLQWQHHERADDLLLTSPLGQGVARIVRNAQGTTLEIPNAPVRHADDLETLTRDALGMPLPVTGLAWWVRAQAIPDRVSEIRRDTLGRPEQIRQDGWVIDYLQYFDDEPMRPKKLLATRDTLKIRLVVDRWSPP